MKRNPCVLVLAAACAGLCLASQAFAGQALRAYLSVPDHRSVGARVTVEALIVNPNDTAATFTYEAKAVGLSVDKKTLKKRVWLGPKAFLFLRWRTKADKEGAATFGLALDGKTAAERTVRVVPGKEAPVIAKLHPLGTDPLVVDMPEPGRKYEIEVEITAGAPGRRAAMLEGLRGVSGFDTNAIIARGIVPAALYKDDAAPMLDVLCALQDASGGWGATPMTVPDARTTSWVVFWLGHLAKAGVKVDAKALDAAIGRLRRSLPDASIEMQARVLAALAANGKTGEKELEAFSEGDVEKLSLTGRLMAAGAGAGVPLPLKERWRNFNATELSTFLALFQLEAEAGTADQPDPMLGKLVMLRGARPRFDTHEAALYALALKKLDRAFEGGEDPVVRIRLDGRRVKTVELNAQNPLARLTVTTEPEPGKKNRLSISRRAGAGLFCRVVVRPAE